MMEEAVPRLVQCCNGFAALDHGDDQQALTTLGERNILLIGT